MTTRSTPDPRENFANSSAQPSMPSLALQALLTERDRAPQAQQTVHVQQQPQDGSQDASGGIMNLAQFADHDLSHLGHLHAVGTRMVLGQSPADAIRGHADYITGMYQAPEDPTLLRRAAEAVE